jgi:hypothetical protein
MRKVRGDSVVETAGLLLALLCPLETLEELLGAGLVVWIALLLEPDVWLFSVWRE